MRFLDADPTRTCCDEKTAAWQCHLINDGAVVQKNDPQRVIMEYYVASLKAQNAVFFALWTSTYGDKGEAVEVREVCTPVFKRADVRLLSHRPAVGLRGGRH